MIFANHLAMSVRMSVSPCNYASTTKWRFTQKKRKKILEDFFLYFINLLGEGGTTGDEERFDTHLIVAGTPFKFGAVLWPTCSCWYFVLKFFYVPHHYAAVRYEKYPDRRILKSKDLFRRKSGKKIGYEGILKSKGLFWGKSEQKSDKYKLRQCTVKMYAYRKYTGIYIKG